MKDKLWTVVAVAAAAVAALIITTIYLSSPEAAREPRYGQTVLEWLTSGVGLYITAASLLSWMVSAVLAAAWPQDAACAAASRRCAVFAAFLAFWGGTISINAVVTTFLLVAIALLVLIAVVWAVIWFASPDAEARRIG